MATDKQIAANRLNAQKAAAPKTVEGKFKSASTLSVSASTATPSSSKPKTSRSSRISLPTSSTNSSPKLPPNSNSSNSPLLPRRNAALARHELIDLPRPQLRPQTPQLHHQSHLPLEVLPFNLTLSALVTRLTATAIFFVFLLAARGDIPLTVLYLPYLWLP